MKDRTNLKAKKGMRNKFHKSTIMKTNGLCITFNKLANYNYSFFKKTNTNNSAIISKLNQTIHPEESTMSRTKVTTSIITTRAKEMEEVLESLEKNETNVPKNEHTAKVHRILNDFLSEIIELDPYFGVILTKLKIEFETDTKTGNFLKDEIEKLKKDNDMLGKSIEEVNGKLDVADALNKLLNMNNEELKREIDETRMDLAETKKKLTEIIEDGLSKKVAEELEGLFNENQYLRQTTSSLKFDLSKSRIREDILISTLKMKDLFTNSIETRLEEAKLGEIEVGRNHIKIPKLNFAMLEYSDSNNDSYSYSFNANGNTNLVKQENNIDLSSQF